MSSFAEIHERICLATHCRTQMELAKVLGIRQSSISDAKRRNSVPGDWFMKLFEKFGLNPDWLKRGVGPMYLRTEQGYMPQDLPTPPTQKGQSLDDSLARSTVIPLHEMPASYTEGAAFPELQVVGNIAIPTLWAHESIVALRMRGRNMGEVVSAGACFGVDTAARDVTSGAVYALYAPSEGLVLRRLFLNVEQNAWLLQSESPDFPEATLAPATLRQRLLGRVVWTMQEL